MGARVYKYGVLPPFENADIVAEQMSLEHKYQNKLTEISRKTRADTRAIEQSHAYVAHLAAASASAKAELLEARKAIKLARSKSRARTETDAMKARVEDCKAASKQAAITLFAARKELRERADVQLERDRIKEDSGAAVRAARAENGLYWGTYQLSEASVAQAAKMPLFDGTEPVDPRFRRWTGDGRIGVQIIGGMSLDDLFAGENTQIRITRDTRPAPVRRDGTPRRTGKADRRILWMRVGSDEKRAAVWAKFPLILHRPLPPSTQLMGATVARRKDGPRERWTAQLSIRVRDVECFESGRGAVAIDLGWRKLPGGIRVASWCGEDGASGEVRLPDELLKSLRHPDELRAVRDKNFNAARDALVQAMAGMHVPAWLSERVKGRPGKEDGSLSQWRSPGRLAALCRMWRDNRFEGDSAAYDALEAWRYHDFHMWAWETAERTKSRRHRREVYRLFSDALLWLRDEDGHKTGSRRYTTAVFEDFDISKLARKKPTEAAYENKTASSNRQLVASSDIRSAVASAFGIHARGVAKVSASQSTHECHACGHVDAFDAAAAVSHVCSRCGAEWDQDENAALVLLRRYLSERDSGGQNTGGARNPENTNDSAAAKESPRQKSKRMAAERRARIEGARKDNDKAAE